MKRIYTLLREGSKEGQFRTINGKVVFMGGPGSGGGSSGSAPRGISPIKEKDEVLGVHQETVAAEGMKPTKAMRFNPNSYGEARTAAVRSSAFLQGEQMYMVPTHFGYRVLTGKPSLPLGQTYEVISATYDKSGRTYSISAAKFKTG